DVHSNKAYFIIFVHSTGMKCIALSKIHLAKGNILHDSHAETLALRAFNSFLLDECYRLALSEGAVSDIITREVNYGSSPAPGQHPFTVYKNSRIFMYCSEAPCGDASMELVMRAQDDATPWPIMPPPLENKKHPGILMGRASFSELGIVRRKPARADAICSLSKSCSDKLALKQCTSVLSAMTSLIISPDNAYIDTLILPEGQCMPESCERAFGSTGRMTPVSALKLPSGYMFRPFNITKTDVDFSVSRKSAREISDATKGSNLSAIWTPSVQETLLNGVIQGRKQGDPRGASVLSRRKMTERVGSIAALCHALAPEDGALFGSYGSIKASYRLSDRRLVKAEVTRWALRGWVKNTEDNFSIELQRLCSNS
ncbi:MAG: hypothetical protein Q9163_006450, partial [Psora crenata]